MQRKTPAAQQTPWPKASIPGVVPAASSSAVGAPPPANAITGASQPKAKLAPQPWPPVFRPHQVTRTMQPALAARPSGAPRFVCHVAIRPAGDALQADFTPGGRVRVASQPALAHPTSVATGQSAQQKPIASRSVVQRYCGVPGCNDPNCHDVSNHGFGQVFNLRGRTVYHGQITSADIGTGTGTSQTTRTYVNSPTTVYPQQVSIEYSSQPAQSGSGGRSEFINQPLAPGQRAQAGHIFGRQYGGYGDQPASVFAQHPQTNMGHTYQGQSTRPLWREHEDEVRRQAQQGGTVLNTVTLRETPHTYYGNACRRCLHANPPGATQCQSCGRPLP
jgi:hypothetical protein